MCAKVYLFIFRNNLNLASYSIKMGQIWQLTLVPFFVRHIEILNVMGFNNQISQSLCRQNCRQNGEIQPPLNLTYYFDKILMSMNYITFDRKGEILLKYVKIEHIQPKLWFLTLIKYLSLAPTFTHKLIYKTFYPKCFWDHFLQGLRIKYLFRSKQWF